MKLEEVVNIDLKQDKKSKDFSIKNIKCCNIKEERLSSKNFIFKTKSFPIVNDFINCVKWNNKKKTISISINENSRFEVYKWIKHIENQSIERKKSAFVDNDIVKIIFNDDSGKNLAEIKFSEIEILDHNCTLNKKNKKDNSLKYNIEISYETINFVDKDDLDNLDCPILITNVPNSASDEEWSSVLVN